VELANTEELVVMMQPNRRNSRAPLDWIEWEPVSFRSPVNAAFEYWPDGSNLGSELARILYPLADRVNGEYIPGETDSGIVGDINGKRVGEWKLT
jgi:hypothetical protein